MKITGTILLILLSTFSFAQTATNWEVSHEKQRIFVENIGQFDAKANEATGEILFAADLPHLKVMFGKSGISYQYRELKKIPKNQRDSIRELTVSNVYEYKQREAMYSKYLVRSDEINMTWETTSPTVEIIPYGLMTEYHSYSVPDETVGNLVNYNYVKQYASIEYQNLLPGINVRFEIHPVEGLKYSVLVAPGANIDDLKMIYDMPLDLVGGKLHIPTLFGEQIEHEPLTFYSDNTSDIIPSVYEVNDQTVGFHLGVYDNTRAIIIDPWVQNPNFNLNWDCVWELDHDAAGNVYAMGGIDNVEILKYNAAGALLWTHTTPYDTTAWLGTMSTDNAGNTYVTNGTAYKIQKINTSGGLVWNNNSPSGPGVGLSTEFWNISFNCDQSKLLIGGSGGGFSIHGRVYDMDMTNGNVLASFQPTAAGGMFSIPIAIQELRAMCSAPNGKYYFVSLDTIGYFSDNLSLCAAGGTSLVKDDHGVGWGYKAENWRYNNTGIKVLRVDSNFIYVNRGNQIQKRDLNSFAILATATIPNGNLQSVFLGGNTTHNAGIDIDDCGNIFVGSTDGVYKFSPALTQLGFYATPSFKVWDVQVTPSGNVIACGGTGTSSTSSRTGGIALFNGVACNPISLTCCNAAFCNPGVLCQTDAPVTLVAETPGGVWSGTGVSPGGVFDPSVAGVGNHPITYTLPCGTETQIIVVIPCNAPLTICEETNGSLTVSGGGGGYLWYDGTSTSTTINITNAATCNSCGGTPVNVFFFYNHCEDAGGNTITSCTQTSFSWNATPYASGVNTAAPATYPIVVVDAVGDSIIVNSAAELLPCPIVPLSVELEDFQLSCADDEVICRWSSSKEDNNDYYLIERVNDAGDFETIALIDGVGFAQTQNTYTYVDRNAPKGRNYYRLSQVDFDGTKEHLVTRTIDCSESEVYVYPNPFENYIRIELSDLYAGAATRIEVIDAVGKTVFSTSYEAAGSQLEIPTEDLRKGVYFLRVQSNEHTDTIKLIRQ